MDCLPRVTPESLIRPQECDNLPAIGEEASRYLDYEPLHDARRRIKKEQRAKEKALEVLTELDARPFDPKAVRAYKKRLSRPWWMWPVTAFDALTCGVFFGCLLYTVVAWIFLGCQYLIFGSCTSWLWFTASWAWLPMVIGFGLALALVAVPWPKWEKISFKDYKEPIPGHALQTAIDIKKRWANADLCVEHLTYTRDHFLVLRLPMIEDDKTFNLHLEVWHEPDFKAERIEVEEALA